MTIAYITEKPLLAEELIKQLVNGKHNAEDICALAYYLAIIGNNDSDDAQTFYAVCEDCIDTNNYDLQLYIEKLHGVNASSYRKDVVSKIKALEASFMVDWDEDGNYPEAPEISEEEMRKAWDILESKAGRYGE